MSYCGFCTNAGGLLPPVAGTDAASGAGVDAAQRDATQQGAQADYDDYLEDYHDELLQPVQSSAAEGGADYALQQYPDYEPQQYPFEYNEGDLVFD